MKFVKQAPILLLSLIFMYAMLFYTFSEKAIFWYLYTFTLLVGIAISLVTEKFEDSLPTWQYLIFGIGYGTITYGIVKVGYLILPFISSNAPQQIANFLAKYGPSTVWHYLLLIFIIVVGEEMFWRGFVQQQLKRFVKSSYAVLITALLFSISVAISGFIPGVIAAFVSGLLWGALYEWKKSLPLIIVSHVVFVLLLFLVLPLT
ncbi:type II CAAX endopeptidase family protein [Metasolibacillus sp.]|uniref:CPBP family intramembrane glutamic endopeptidase n=1 Tax=Metasolibacillus sp. TaxID=2703680 RepID=UPI0025FCFDF9|nr:type II CAAX endopeptidase family protein [Metasolibacillus sp.]MCT6924130.1 CPBP family intramembrane metalloprotease [Metasolibacillus sp.]MCT6940237.1 CPBP family intramembrane metalloprotease [Metasolibacillus sp.]